MKCFALQRYFTKSMSKTEPTKIFGKLHRPKGEAFASFCDDWVARTTIRLSTFFYVRTLISKH